MKIVLIVLLLAMTVRMQVMTCPFSTTVSSPLLARLLRAVCAALL